MSKQRTSRASTKRTSSDAPRRGRSNATPNDIVNEVLTTRYRLKCKNEKQKEYAKLIAEKEITICAGPAGVGKAQPLTSKILTPNGWTTMGEIVVGDQVIGSDGKPTNVIGVFPQGEKEIYRVYFSDGSYTDCCDEHLWYTETYNDRNHRIKQNGKRIYSPRKGKVKSLKEIMDTLYTKRGDKNHTIPMVKPVMFEEQELEINPYILGCLLGDGNWTQGRITLSSADDEIINNINQYLMEEVMVEKIKSSQYGYSIKAKKKGIGNNIVLNNIKKLKLLGTNSSNKFIPEKYLFNSINNRILLLQGLMDTDGTVNKNGTTTTFTTISKKLMDGIKDLVQSLGGTIKVKSRVTNYSKYGVKVNGKLSYRAVISLPPEINPFKLSRKRNLVKPKSRYTPKRYIVKIEKHRVEEAQCIMVDNDDRLYVTDDYIVTHNTYVAIAKAIELLQNKTNRYDKLVVCTPAVDADESLGFLPGDVREKLLPYVASSLSTIDKIIGKSAREKLEQAGIIEIEALAFIRGSSIDNTIFIMEEAQNMTKGQMKMLLTRIGDNSKFIISGDLEQSDRFKNTKFTGLYDIMSRAKKVPAIGLYEYKVESDADIVRNPIIGQILSAYVDPEKPKPAPKKPTQPKPQLLTENKKSVDRKPKKKETALSKFLSKFKW